MTAGRWMRGAAAGVCLGVGAGAWLCGCADEDEYDTDYMPPGDQGALTVNNRTFTDLTVYVDGERARFVDDESQENLDLSPGTHRIVLIEEEGDRSYEAEVEILEDRLLVLDVTVGGGLGLREYSVDWFYN